jgi:glycosyltransferase involved in cell wall biosynthesis
MEDKPLISIVTCFLNEERFLQEAIESILQQDYRNWELLLIDDGSTDNSPVIAKKYSQQYPDKIFYHEHEEHVNKGLSASKNHAIRQARGKLIAFLDGDDVWLPAYLSNQVKVMQQQAAPVICEGADYWYNWDGSAQDNVITPIGAEGNKMYAPPELLLRLYPLGQAESPCTCATLVQKEVVQRYGGFEEAFPGMYEDQVFLTKVYLHEKVYISTACNNRYRQRQGSLVHNAHSRKKYHRERKRFLEWMEQYLASQEINMPEVREKLDQALFPYRHPFLNFFIHVIPTETIRFLRNSKYHLKNYVKTKIGKINRRKE